MAPYDSMAGSQGNMSFQQHWALPVRPEKSARTQQRSSLETFSKKRFQTVGEVVGYFFRYTTVLIHFFAKYSGRYIRLTSDSSTKTADSSTNASTTKVRQLKTAVSSTKVRQPKSRIRQPRGSSTKKVGFVNQKTADSSTKVRQPRFVNQKHGFVNQEFVNQKVGFVNQKRRIRQPRFVNQKHGFVNQAFVNQKVGFVNQKRRIRQPSFVNQNNGFINQDFVNQKVGFVQKRRIRRFRNIFSMFGGRKVVINSSLLSFLFLIWLLLLLLLLLVLLLLLLLPCPSLFGCSPVGYSRRRNRLRGDIYLLF